MNTNKIIIGGIVGGVALFFLGWLIYGMLLMDYMNANSNTCAMRPEEDFVWWAMILSNIISGLFIALVFSWAGVKTVMKGAQTAALVAFMVALFVDLSMYSMSESFSGLTAVGIDVAAFVVMFAIAGAIMAWVMNRGASE